MQGLWLSSMAPLVFLSLAEPHSALLNIVFTCAWIDGILLTGGKPKSLQSYTIIYTTQVFNSVGADHREMPHPGRVYITKTVAGIAEGQGAASREDYLNGPRHRGGRVTVLLSPRGMDLPPAGSCYC